LAEVKSDKQRNTGKQNQYLVSRRPDEVKVVKNVPDDSTSLHVSDKVID